jgi:hypothetical protein
MMAEIKEKSGVAGKEGTAPTSPLTAAPDQEWIFTVNGSSGEVVKVEKRNTGTGEREEISQDEYAALTNAGAYQALAASYGTYAAPQDPYYASSYDPYYAAAYYQGASDYDAVVQAQLAAYTYSPVEQAYYQGIADYASALG